MDDQAASDRDPADGSRARLQAYPYAEEQPDRLLHGLLRHVGGLRDGLAHLVAGRGRRRWRLRRLRVVRLAAIAQMAVHLIFFLHLTTAPDNTNNILALAFGILIVTLVVGGSLWIMYNLNHNMMPMDQMMHMQR